MVDTIILIVSDAKPIQFILVWPRWLYWSTVAHVWFYTKYLFPDHDDPHSASFEWKYWSWASLQSTFRGHFGENMQRKRKLSVPIDSLSHMYPVNHNGTTWFSLDWADDEGSMWCHLRHGVMVQVKRCPLLSCLTKSLIWKSAITHNFCFLWS